MWWMRNGSDCPGRTWTVSRILASAGRIDDVKNAPGAVMPSSECNPPEVVSHAGDGTIHVSVEDDPEHPPGTHRLGILPANYAIGRRSWTVPRLGRGVGRLIDKFVNPAAAMLAGTYLTASLFQEQMSR